MRTAVSFFAGAGGLDLGIERAGFDIRLSVELESVYCQTLRNNHPELNVIQGDIMAYNRELIYTDAGLAPDEELDLMIGGSPCQSFSTAGKRQAFEDPRGQAMLKYADLVNEVQPKFFLLENVKGLLSAALKHRPLNKRGIEHPPLEPEEEQGSALNHLLQHFGNYNVKLSIINAADYGIPQTRERVFIVGVRNDLGIEFEFPESTHNKDGSDGKLPWVTMGQVLENLNITEHHYMNYSEERLRFMRLIPQGGGNWRDLRVHGDEIVREAMGGAYNSGGGKVGFFRRLSVNKPSPTLLTSPAQKSTNLGHPYEDRPLSIEEYLFIQGFPTDFRVAGSLMKQYTQIGNAVPVQLAEILGRSILHHIQTVQMA
ncbi:DNA cytosine methyltransferase [Domibacillus indicus]|uniref:DNA cytosine methyltransferase n=1 Tax=Domibacillus indicus TaxID=1437523 RepID=UPI000617CF6B|nr:DNA cytosine methyltransferase [Domibacillus indicus]